MLLQRKEGGQWITDEAVKLDECSDENPSDIMDKEYNINFIPRAITLNKDKNKMLLAMQVRHEKQHPLLSEKEAVAYIYFKKHKITNELLRKK